MTFMLPSPATSPSTPPTSATSCCWSSFYRPATTAADDDRIAHAPAPASGRVTHRFLGTPV